MTDLRPCDECGRHVFASEPKCPFCASPLPAQPAKPPSLLQAGLSRAQRYAMAAAVASTAATGCSKYHEEPQRGEAGTQSAGGSAASAGTAGDAAAGGRSGRGGTAGDPFIPQPMYGGGIPQPVYGASFDAGNAAGSGAVDAGRADEDAGQDDTPPGIPIYGASFPWLKLIR